MTEGAPATRQLLGTIAVLAIVTAVLAIVVDWSFGLLPVITGAVLVLGVRRMTGLEVRPAVVASAPTVAFLCTFNFALWPYLGFVLLPGELVVGAVVLRRRTPLRWPHALALVSVARCLAIALVHRGYFVDLFT